MAVTSTATTEVTTTATTVPQTRPAIPEPNTVGYLSDSDSPVFGISWSPVSSTLAIAGREIRLWDADTGNVFDAFGRADTVSWSVDGTLLAAEYGTSVRFWDASTLELTGGLDLGSEVRGVALSPDNVAAVIGLASGALETWNLSDQSIISEFDHRSMVLSVGWSPAGRFASGGAWDGTLILIDAGEGELVAKVTGYSTRRSDVNGLQWSPDGSLLATAHQDGVIRVWDIAGVADDEPEVVAAFDVPSGWLVGVAWSPDGAQIAGAGETGLIRVWEVATGEVIAETQGILEPVWALSWSADGGLLAAAGATAQGGGVVVYEVP